MLQLIGIEKRYGNRLILKNINFSLTAGTITLLGGANGSGKSTLLHIIAGLIPQDSGHVMHALPAGSIGYLGHQSLLYPALTVTENLAFWRRLHGVPSSEHMVAAALRRMELDAFCHEKAGTLSRGMSQRLSLARLLLLKPQLFLLDEPGAGMDAPSLELLRRELLLAKTQGSAILWVTHSLADDISCADWVLLLADRQLAYSGPAHNFPNHALPAGNTS